MAAKVAAAQAAASVNNKWREETAASGGGDTKHRNSSKEGRGKPDSGKRTFQEASGTSSHVRGSAPGRTIAASLEPLAQTKLTPCPRFIGGACAFGQRCPLAHSLKDVYRARRPFQRGVEAKARKGAPSASAGAVASGSSRSSPARSRASKASHGRKPVKRAKMIGFSEDGASDESDERASTDMPTVYHKTRVCRPFLDGKCRKGESCTYAHSQKELLQPGEARWLAQANLAQQHQKAGKGAAAQWWSAFGRPAFQVSGPQT